MQNANRFSLAEMVLEITDPSSSVIGGGGGGGGGWAKLEAMQPAEFAGINMRPPPPGGAMVKF